MNSKPSINDYLVEAQKIQIDGCVNNTQAYGDRIEVTWNSTNYTVGPVVIDTKHESSVIGARARIVNKRDDLVSDVIEYLYAVYISDYVQSGWKFKYVEKPKPMSREEYKSRLDLFSFFNDKLED